MAITAADRGAPRYWFPIPSASAVLVDAAQRAYQEWRATNPLLTGKPLAGAAFGPVAWFDAARAGFTSVLCSYTAIEGEVNLLIPTGRVYVRPLKNGKVERLKHDRILELGLKEKLVSVLPTLRGVSDPTRERFWADFETVQALRHRIVHLTPSDVKHAHNLSSIPDTVWSRIFDPNLPDPAQVAHQLLRHVSGTDAPRWIRYWPY